MTAIAALGVLRAERLAAAADVIGAMSLEAYLGTERVFDRRLNDLRPHPGQERVAANLRALLGGSEIMQSHAECDRVQDPYSFRCIPVVHGAVRDSTAHVRRVTEIEANSVTDNPLVFPEDGEFISGGNFHGEPIALAIDFLKLAISELASIAERRLYLLLNAEDRGLPLFLTERLGLAIRPDDRAIHRGRARQRQQGTCLAVERRFDSDVGRSRGSRQHGDDLGE